MGLLSTFRKIMPALTKTNTKAEISSPESQSVGMASSVSDWANLPTDLLESVLDRIVDFSDFIRFCSICQAWRFIALQPPQLDSHSQSNRLRRQHKQNLHLLKTCRNQLPMLLTIYRPPYNKDDNHEDEDHKWHLYNVTEGTSYNIIQMPIRPNSQVVCGSFRGWLFTINRYSMVISLINPFLIKEFSLPPVNVMPGNVRILYPRKAIVLYNPGQVNYEVFIMLYKIVGCLPSKTQTWAWIDTPNGYFVSDITSYKGRIYTMSSNGNNLMYVDVSRHSCTHVATVAKGKIYADRNHLVESQEGDLLLVREFINNRDVGTTVLIEVYKLLLPSRRQRCPKWARIHRIGEQALFISTCNTYESISISTRDFPMFKPNCVYDGFHYYDISAKMPQQGVYWTSSPYLSGDGGCPHPGLSIWIVPYFKT